MQLSLHRESMWLQALSTEELLANPAYESVVVAYFEKRESSVNSKKCL